MNHIIWLVVKWIPPDCHCHLPGKSQPIFSHVIVSYIYWSQFTLCALQNISLKDKIPVFAFQIMQNTLSPYWAEVYAGRRDICAILLDVPRCFSTEVGHGVFGVRQALLSCALGSGNVAYLEKTDSSLSLSPQQIRFLRLQDKNNYQGMVNSNARINHLTPQPYWDPSLFRSIVCAIDACPADFQSCPHIVGTQSIRKTSLCKEADTIVSHRCTITFDPVQSACDEG